MVIDTLICAFGFPILLQASLQYFFDPQHYLNAHNEMPYVNAHGELKRIDRLVELDGEVWVLDCKTGDSADPAYATLQVFSTINKFNKQ